MKLKPFLIVSCYLAFVWQSCKKGEQPELVWEEDHRVSAIELISGDRQSGIFGERLRDSIVLKVSGRDGDKRYYWLDYQFRKGNGQVDAVAVGPEYVDKGTPDKDGYVRLKWELGCNSEQQELLVRLFSDTVYHYPGGGETVVRRPDDSVVISAKGIKPTGWGKACGCGIINPYDARFFAHADKLYLINPDRITGGLYVSEDGGFNWKLIQFPIQDEIVAARFDQSNRLYVLTRNFGIYYADNLSSWRSLNNGFLGTSNGSTLLVDNQSLFVGFDYNGIYRSNDRGAFWRKLLIENNFSTPYRFITKHPNGNLYVFDKWDNFYKSGDNGDHWEQLYVDHQYINYKVDDFKVGPDGNLYIGAGDATLSVISPDSLQGTKHSYYEWNGSSQHINNISFYNNHVYYLVNWTNNPGIYSSANNWEKIELNFKKRIANYYLKNANDFLLVADDNIYVNYK